MPYQVNKSKMVEKIAELVREKRVEGISDLRDESNKKGVRVVIELKKDAYGAVVLNQLFSYSQMQTSFGVNMLALNKGRPEQMNVLDFLKAFVEFRENVITRRTAFLLNKSRERAHVLIGLAIAVDSIDEVISIIRGSKDTAEARVKLLARDWQAEQTLRLIQLVDDRNNEVKDGKCFLTEDQVQAILDMKLARLTGLERGKIEKELDGLAQEIKEYLRILGDRSNILAIMKEELAEIKEKYATPRRSIIEESEYEHDIEDLIAEEDMVLTVTVSGYIKRVPLDTYRAQKRGGKGRAGLKSTDDDPLVEMFATTTHTPVLFFSNLGKVYKLKTYKIPVASPQARGRALINIFPLQDNEKITTIMPLPKDEDSWDALNLMFATANGNIRRSDMVDFKRIQTNGKIAIRLDETDSLIGVAPCQDSDHVLLATKFGKSIRFDLEKVRVIKSRTSNGIRGIKFAKKGDQVISLTILHGSPATREERDVFLRIPLEIRHQIAKGEEYDKSLVTCELSEELIKTLAEKEQFILTITENGFGKRSSAYEYRRTNRGGSGIINIVTSERNGNIISSFPANDDEQIIIMTDKGKLIRCKVSDIRIAGRNTQGVRVLRIDSNEKVVSTTLVSDSGEDEEIDDENIENLEEATVDSTPVTH
jgi:DNA gyrase subunit A